jgi:hypothetical protein
VVGGGCTWSKIAAAAAPKYHHEEMAPTLRLTPEEDLEFQQFQQIDFWKNQSLEQNTGVISGETLAVLEEKTASLPTC